MHDVYRTSNSSFRRNASAAFRNDSYEIFSSSSRAREDDDDEALKWAALEKLPTFDRLRKGLLFGSRGVVNEVDVENLGFQERKQLVERLVKVVEEDNEKFLLKLKNRIDRVGINLPTIEVRYEHLNVETEVHVEKQSFANFKKFLYQYRGGICNQTSHIPEQKESSPDPSRYKIIVFFCRMTLLLGPPNSGKTTLLLALAGKLDPALKFSGHVTYNGHGMNEFVPQRTAAYISQHDVHIGELTVRETLAFSAKCQGVGSSLELLRREKDANIMPDPDVDMYMKIAAMEGQEASVITDYIIKILGLEICADTMVGDQMLRGISGGQRKRVTTGEMLVGPAKALFMDEISTGLDSSTTLQVVHSMRQFVHILNGTALISLLQPEPETYDLFDDIILMSEGQIVYQGPREFVLEFFQSMGFKCPERKGITSKKDQQQYWVHHDKPYRYITVREFAEAFKSSEIGGKLIAELAIPFDKIMFGGVSDIAMTIQKLPVFYKQRNLFFYPAWAYGLPSWIIKIPAQAVEVAAYVALTYYVIGYDPNVGRECKEVVVMGLLYLTSDVDSKKNVSLGVEVVKSKGFFPGTYWYWIGLGALFGMTLLYNSSYILALTYLNPLGKAQAVLPEDDTQENDRGATEDRLVLLNGVSGAFRTGVLTALMGVSGAGKTTLMDVLAGRKTGGYIEGNITVSGYPKKQETFARICGY
ncbi:pleiotropic drug resistance protein 1 [Phtheirospermum japonicum]|uniref:Pleiotropic drug resistance protein 1 n=1 Tax=Phtheirospermum japonicum TaxID=374723 RepID=A0A830CLT7_9LAMI|nr:pleiotropic drug resistance protein 1 [Phtheirospermum japonicum]